MVRKSNQPAIASALALEVLERRVLLAAELVKDIHLIGDSHPVSLAGVGDTLYFTANDGVHGRELWSSDGTFVGTNLVKDIYRGAGGDGGPVNLTSVGDKLFFTSAIAPQLWKSDGTAKGTVLVAEIGGNNLVDVNGTLFFGFQGGLFKSDGTNAGTVLVERGAFPGDRKGSQLQNLTQVNDTVFFTFSIVHEPPFDDLPGSVLFRSDALWRSDGTTAGTFQMKPDSHGLPPGQLTDVDGTLYFVYEGELWKSDGTAAGTGLVKESGPSAVQGLTNVGGILYFTTSDGIHGRELWKSDGTAEGTVMVKDIRAGSQGAEPTQLTDVNGVLFFSADDGVNSRELWRSDGTQTGTFLVKDIDPGTLGSFPQNLTHVDGILYFDADAGSDGRELWQSDGTADGTFLVEDINPGGGSSSPQNLTNVNGTLYFTADDGIHGRELWTVPFASVSDGVLMVRGTNGPDTISVASSAGTFIVRRQGIEKVIDGAGVTRVQLDSLDGKDVITLPSFHTGSHPSWRWG